MTPRASEIKQSVLSLGSPAQAEHSLRFFKAGKGQYGYGDKFCGVRNPEVRLVVKCSKNLVSLSDIESLLADDIHEVRLVGLLLLVELMKNADRQLRKPKSVMTDLGNIESLVDFYLAHAERANNWDLVDLSAPYTLGLYLTYDSVSESRKLAILDSLSDSDNLWRQRISVVSTLMPIRHYDITYALRQSLRHLRHPHDLMHKAVGWTLREVGKKDTDALRQFLTENLHFMSRTTLRYAIERLSEYERQEWLKK